MRLHSQVLSWFRLFSTTYLLVSLSGGADVILQELGLDLAFKVSEQGTVSLLPQEEERKRRKERKGVNEPFFAVLWGKNIFQECIYYEKVKVIIYPVKT